MQALLKVRQGGSVYCVWGATGVSAEEGGMMPRLLQLFVAMYPERLAMQALLKVLQGESV